MTPSSEGGEFSYGSYNEQKVVVKPGLVANSPICLILHEGGWQAQNSGTRSVAEGVAETMHAEGFATFNVEWPQTTGETTRQPPAFPQQTESIEEALAWAKANAAAFNANPNHVVFLGGSAGGHLAILTAQLLNRKHGAGYVKGAAGLSAPLNFVTLVPLALTGQYLNSGSVRKAIGASSNKEMEEQPPALVKFEEDWSPFYQIDKATSPKILIATSVEGDLVPPEQTKEMAAKLGTVGGITYQEILHAGTAHAFAYWGAVSAEVVAFLKAA